MEEVQGFVGSAFEQLDVPVESGGSGNDLAADLVLDPWGSGVRLQLKRVALATEQSVERLVSQEDTTKLTARRADDHDLVLFVVADRVTGDARRLLMKRGAGYLDLRGHLGLRAPGLIIDADVEPVVVRSDRVSPLGGKAGLEVAAALLMRPERTPAVRELARDLSRSPSTVSEILAAMRGERLIDSDNRLSDARLFWELVEHWRYEDRYLEHLPDRGGETVVSSTLRLGDDDLHRVGWALAGSAGAVAHGAPVAVRADQPLEFYVPDRVVLNRAQKLLGELPGPEHAACSVRIAPVPAVCAQRVRASRSYFDWPVAHPLFVALDLAQDRGRGREVLDDWTPAGGWPRVW
ncbi:transcriptional regulator [Kribbella antiqua]|uniref:transcriptional regulator n=1 Tax=Kribbella antiqua TaxID=2512217 RepID=UPI0018EEC546|nr:transcriptional regulator [Kribbella antiqua]